MTRSTTSDSDEEIGKIYSRNSFQPLKVGRKTGAGVDLSTRRSSSDKDRFSFVVSYQKDSHVGGTCDYFEVAFSLHTGASQRLTNSLSLYKVMHPIPNGRGSITSWCTSKVLMSNNDVGFEEEYSRE